MRGIRILSVGKIKEDYFKEGIAHYVGEIRKKCPIDMVECVDEPTPDKASKAEENIIRQKEGARLLGKIAPEDWVVALCIDGTHITTNQWKKQIKQRSAQVRGSLVFVIGGSLGLSPEVEKRANEKLSFSKMTFPHQMMRMILCEQIAKALGGGEPFLSGC